MSSLFQSSRTAGTAGTATPVNNARPGSELVRLIVEPSGFKSCDFLLIRDFPRMCHGGARYQFGDFCLDVGEQCLLRRDTGERILLTTKVLDTLVYFVEHAGETLDKDVLLRSIWPGTIVEENSLTQNVSTLCQLLGEARGDNRYIATIPRRGYRFVAEVSRLDADAPLSNTAEANAPGQFSAAPHLNAWPDRTARRYSGPAGPSCSDCPVRRFY
jgi:DNA-binding winged helix-turn-helix (wHTH) protein